MTSKKDPGYIMLYEILVFATFFPEDIRKPLFWEVCNRGGTTGTFCPRIPALSLVDRPRRYVVRASEVGSAGNLVGFFIRVRGMQAINCKRYFPISMRTIGNARMVNCGDNPFLAG
jgi:hypothetical protein